MLQLTLLERVHACNLLHRDIKPGNFLVGRGAEAGKLHLIDFGLAGAYRDTNGRHIPYNSSAHFHGTDKYASINSHMKIGMLVHSFGGSANFPNRDASLAKFFCGLVSPAKPVLTLSAESSRRDDLESVAYTLIYLAKGELPWQYVTNKQIRRKRMGQMKMRILPEELCIGLPRCFEELLRYAMSLEFGQDPNYMYLRSLLEQTLNATPGGWAAPFEWATPAAIVSAPAPMFYVSPVHTELDDPMQEDEHMMGGYDSPSPQTSSQGRATPPISSIYPMSHQFSSKFVTPTVSAAPAQLAAPQWIPHQLVSQHAFLPAMSAYCAPSYAQPAYGFHCPAVPSVAQFRRPSSSSPSDEMEIDLEPVGGHRESIPSF